MLKERGFKPGMMSAKELTGAPLISLAPSNNRRLRRTKTYQPFSVSENRYQSVDQASSYYHGQNLYQVINPDIKLLNLQEVYFNKTHFSEDECKVGSRSLHPRFL